MSIRLAVSAFAAALFLGVAAVAADIPQDEAGFTAYVADALRHELAGTSVEVKGPLTILVGTAQASLDRVWRGCQADAASCEAGVGDYVHAIAEAHKQQGAPVDRAAVRLVVRTAAYVERSQQSMGDDAPQLQVEALPSGLVAVAVADAGRSLKLLSDRQLAELGLTHDQLFDLARENMRKALAPVLDRAKPADHGQIGSVGGSIYEVGRVAMADQWAALAQAQHETLVVAMPTTDVVLYVSEATPGALDALSTLAQTMAAKAPNPLAPKVLLRWRDGRWVAAN